MRRRREFEIFTMSFLDAICCGFGSMILLFIVTRVSEPQRLDAGDRNPRHVGDLGIERG